MSDQRTLTYPVNVNVRLTIEQHAAIASIAAENGVSHSEAARLLLEMGYADLRRRMGQALRDHAAEPDELAQGESAERADTAKQLGDALRFAPLASGDVDDERVGDEGPAW